MPINQLLNEGVAVLTSSRRLAHALRIDHATQARQQGRRAWRTPVVLPLTAWLRQQWLEARVTSSDSRCLRLLTPAQARLIWEQTLASSPLAADLLDPTEAARVARRSWQRLQEYLIDHARLQEFDTPEARALSVWGEEFERRCRDMGALDEAHLARWAWDAGLQPSQPLAFAGFDALPSSIERLHRRWHMQGHIRQVAAPTPPISEVKVLSADDREREIELAARWARQQLEGGKQRIALVMSDLHARRDEVHRRMEEVFTPAARGVEELTAEPVFLIAAPIALSSYPIVAAALAVLRLAQGHAGGSLVGRLLRSPFLRGAEREGSARALADARLRKEQRDDWDLYELERWAGANACTELELACREAARVHRELPRRSPPSHWAERFHMLLRALGWPGERTASSVEQQTVRKFVSTLAELGSLDGVVGQVSLTAAIHELSRLAAETNFESETPSTCITIIDPFTVSGMSFDAVWIAGLEATHWPAATSPDPLIPLPLQREARIPEACADMSLAHSRARLLRLVASAPAAILSWPQREGDAELQMSPLLAAWPQGASHELSLRSEGTWQQTLFERRPELEILDDELAPRLLLQSAHGGARTLELQSLCPFRAQAELRLRAQPLERLSSGIGARQRGTLVHAVLEAIWRELGDQATLITCTGAELERRLLEVAQLEAATLMQNVTRPKARLAQLEVANVVRQVLQLLAIDRLRPAFRVRRAERGEDFQIGGLQLRVQLDRVDRLAEGDFLVDYKLGESQQPRQWLDVRPGRPRQPQLPLYALAYEKELAGLAFAVLAPGAVGYRGWSNGAAIAPGVAAYPDGVRSRHDIPADWHALLQHWRGVLTELATQYIDGHASVDPLPQACDYCHLSTFCRIHERAVIDEDMEVNADE